MASLFASIDRKNIGMKNNVRKLQRQYKNLLHLKSNMFDTPIRSYT